MSFLRHDSVTFASSFITLYIYIYIVLHKYGGASPVPTNTTVPALIVFGDSIVDPGNNNYIKTIARCNFPPYGKDFEGGNPSGRFSNGRIPSDIIAEMLGVKKLLPAYLDPSLQPQDLLTGVSFASGASGYDPLTSKIRFVLSLDDQLKLFKEYINKTKTIAGDEGIATILSKGIFLVCIGSNDIATTSFRIVRRLKYDMNSYTDLMLKSASNFLKELHGLGARKIGIFSVPPIGCVPAQRTLRGGISRECSEKENKAALLFNSKLSSEIDSLGKKFPHSRFVYLDIYYPLLKFIQNPAQYGFEVAKKGCCGTGFLEASILCNELPTCPDASKYVFWDGYHLSEKAYLILTPIALNQSINKLL